MVQKTLSIPQDLDDFLDEHPDLSCSKMLQSKIIEIRENRKIKFAEMETLKRHNVFLSKKLETCGDLVVDLEQEIVKLKNDLEKERNKHS